MIDIYFDKLYRYPRIQECVSIAVPFKKGELKDISEVAVLQNGRECVIQPRVTAWHNDGSVKYLLLPTATVQYGTSLFHIELPQTSLSVDSWITKEKSKNYLN